MKFTVALLPLLFASVTTSISLFSGSQMILADDGHDVPGKNPLRFCQNEDKYSLTINYVDLSPNPPLPGKTLTIKASGNFTAEVVEGAYINLSVKYGLITLLRQQADLCEQMKNVDEECPLDGEKTLTKDVELPARIPPGHYSVLADVYTKDNKQVTCLTAVVQFG
ncbi:Phosphatidylglycerol/phosphatidylinositol transfer protein [Pseudocyphellaria aurata]|nr:Phosphatidylglycerol/phosphatidylinositol transfer protein [Pseudocyphellaria aurata]